MMEASEASAQMGAHMTASEPAAKMATVNVTASEATPMTSAASRFRSSRKQATGEGG
jgi:hypothetical protein